jgi:hypothetical protein
MQGATKKRMVVGNQDFVCGHFSNDPVFLWDTRCISGLAKTTRGAATQQHQQGTFNANYVKKAAFQTLAAP